MGKVVEIRVYRSATDEEPDETIIVRRADLVAIDDEGEKFKVYRKFPIDLDNDPDEKIQEIIREAEAWISQSRKRYERALEIANRLGIPLKVG